MRQQHFNIGTTTVTWIATDVAGNTQTCTQIVTVTDTEKPTISCPSDLSIAADAGLCTATGVNLGTATATDNCSTGANLVITNDAPAIFNIGTTTVTWTATDAAGNTQTCMQSVTVSDTEKPLLTVPTTKLALGCNPAILPTEASVVDASSATDNCSVTISAVAGTITGSCSKSQTFNLT